ncbi:MAG: hypothetical protein JWM80_3904 [Cyanobacteria bacterium RYN_339]|nr:hypothetical protein [Cyanobacteria bacterium RYN_339]
MRRLLATLALLLAAAPAAASTVPRVDFQGHQTSVSFGLLDFDVDQALGDRLAVGVSTNVLSIAPRLTYRLGGDPATTCWGVTLAAGPSIYPVLAYGSLSPTAAPILNGPSGYVQPALVWSTVLGGNFTFRGTLGPVLFAQLNSQAGGSYRYIDSLVVPLWPNFELAYKWGLGEFTLGGGVLGFRLAI